MIVQSLRQILLDLKSYGIKFKVLIRRKDGYDIRVFLPDVNLTDIQMPTLHVFKDRAGKYVVGLHDNINKGSAWSIRNSCQILRYYAWVVRKFKTNVSFTTSVTQSKILNNLPAFYHACYKHGFLVVTYKKVGDTINFKLG